MADDVLTMALKAARAALDSTLAACPHCAGQIINPRHYGMDFSGPVTLVIETPGVGSTSFSWGVRCFNPGCGAATLYGNTAEEAVECWNRRPLDGALR